MGRDMKPGTQVCTGCQKELPRTPQYFYQASEIGSLFSRCKACMQQDADKVIRERAERLALPREKRPVTVAPQPAPRSTAVSVDIVPNNQVVYDRRHLTNRASTLAAHSRYRGSYGKIPSQDLWLKMELQDWRCMYCKDKVSFFTCCFDHIWPVVKGGETYLYNIALTCTWCNSAKHSRSLRRFCKAMHFDYDTIVQEIAEINRKLHDLVDWGDGEGIEPPFDAS